MRAKDPSPPPRAYYRVGVHDPAAGQRWTYVLSLPHAVECAQWWRAKGCTVSVTAYSSPPGP